MKIGYKEIAQIYDDSNCTYLCHAIELTYLDAINPDKVLHQISIDVYGPVFGRIRTLINKLTWSNLFETMFPNIGPILGLDHYTNEHVNDLMNSYYDSKRRQFRLDVLHKLAERFPETQFELVQ